MAQVVKAGLAFITGATAFAPVPYLSHAFHLLEEINSLIQHVKGIRSRMKNLVSCIEILIQGLESKLRASQSLLPYTRKGINELEKLLEDIRDSARDFAARGFFSLALMRSEAHSTIQGYHSKVMTTAVALNIDIHLANQGFLMSHEDARSHDHLEILAHMKTLESNQEKLIEELHEANRSSSPINPAHLHEKLKDCPEYHPEREFLQDAIHHMPPQYPVLAFPEPETAEPVVDLSGTMSKTSTLIHTEEAVTTQHPPSKPRSFPTNEAVYVSPLVTEPTSMLPGETIVPEPVCDGEILETGISDNQQPPALPPFYGDHSSKSSHRSYEFEYVQSALQAWNWNAPELGVMETNTHMPIAQIIFRKRGALPEVSLFSLDANG